MSLVRLLLRVTTPASIGKGRLPPEKQKSENCYMTGNMRLTHLHYQCRCEFIQLVLLAYWILPVAHSSYTCKILMRCTIKPVLNKTSDPQARIAKGA